MREESSVLLPNAQAGGYLRIVLPFLALHRIPTAPDNGALGNLLLVSGTAGGHPVCWYCDLAVA